jgi:hypothetical protein
MTEMFAHLLVEVVTTKLDSRIRHNANAVCPVASHKSPPALLTPDPGQGLANRLSVFFTASTLDLVQDLKPFQWRHNCT